MEKNVKNLTAFFA